MYGNENVSAQTCNGTALYRVFLFQLVCFFSTCLFFFFFQVVFPLDCYVVGLLRRDWLRLRLATSSVCGRATRVFNLEISSLHAVHTHKHGARGAIFHSTL